jgi:phosphatidylinositol glycan class K
MEFFENRMAIDSNGQTKSSLGNLFSSFDPSFLLSNPHVRSDLFKRDVEKVPITDFFGQVRQSNQSDHVGRKNIE